MIIWITGCKGVGKSSLVKNLFPNMRKHGRIPKTMETDKFVMVGDYSENHYVYGWDNYLSKTNEFLYSYIKDLQKEDKIIVCDGVDIPTVNILSKIKDNHILILLDSDVDSVMERIVKRNRYVKLPDERTKKWANSLIDSKRTLLERVRALGLAKTLKVKVNLYPEDEVANIMRKKLSGVGVNI